MQERFYVPSFHFQKSGLCYCGSQKLFGDCCASSSETQQVPKRINIKSGFLSPAECNRFLRFAEKRKREWLKVVDSEKSTNGKRVYKRHPNRVTQEVDLGKKQKQADDWFTQACEEEVKSFYGAKPAWFEVPRLLRYEHGGKYDVHSDADHYCTEAQQFYRFIDRDFSMLLYLNDDYEGGGLYFKGLDFHYQPKQGDLVMFPSNHIFSHESLPITSGKKYALVSWGAFHGTPRVSSPRSVYRL